MAAAVGFVFCNGVKQESIHGLDQDCKKKGSWEVQATRTPPSDSLASLYEVAKCLTMKQAVYLDKEVAAILRAVLTHET